MANGPRAGPDPRGTPAWARGGGVGGGRTPSGRAAAVMTTSVCGASIALGPPGRGLDPSVSGGRDPTAGEQQGCEERAAASRHPGAPSPQGGG